MRHADAQKPFSTNGLSGEQFFPRNGRRSFLADDAGRAVSGMRALLLGLLAAHGAHAAMRRKSLAEVLTVANSALTAAADDDRYDFLSDEQLMAANPRAPACGSTERPFFYRTSAAFCKQCETMVEVIPGKCDAVANETFAATDLPVLQTLHGCYPCEPCMADIKHKCSGGTFAEACPDTLPGPPQNPRHLETFCRRCQPAFVAVSGNCAALQAAYQAKFADKELNAEMKFPVWVQESAAPAAIEPDPGCYNCSSCEASPTLFAVCGVELAEAAQPAVSNSTPAEPAVPVAAPGRFVRPCPAGNPIIEDYAEAPVPDFCANCVADFANTPGACDAYKIAKDSDFGNSVFNSALRDAVPFWLRGNACYDCYGCFLIGQDTASACIATGQPVAE